MHLIVGRFDALLAGLPWEQLYWQPRKCLLRRAQQTLVEVQHVSTCCLMKVVHPLIFRIMHEMELAISPIAPIDD